MAFKEDELKFKDNTSAEHIRTRAIFEVLKEKVIKKETLTELEKDFFCQGVKFSNRNDGVVDNYECCDNYKFKNLYLIYFHDLTGNGHYYKANNMSILEVKANELKKDLQYLYAKSNEWDLEVNKTDHSEELIKQLSSEVRQEELKNLSRLPEFQNNVDFANSSDFLLKKRAILLQSKFIYCIALEILDTLDKSDFIFELNSIQIEFNEYSLVHILNRHYSEVVKQYKSKKSFHNIDFKPRMLSSQLKEIIEKIDNSKLFQGKPINKIAFQFYKIDYVIYTHEREKSVKGIKGNIKYTRLETFFKITDRIEKDILNSKFSLKEINQTLSVYIPI